MAAKQKFCIFCGGSSLSKEHMWSEWIAPLVPDLRGRNRTESRMVMANCQHVESPIFKDRPGSPLTKKFRVVCQACNNTWMSEIEQGTAPLLTPMIKGDRFSILPEGRNVLATWIALKVMVSEHAFDDVVVSEANKYAFRRNRTIPDGLSILVGSTADDVEPVMYLRQAANITLPAEHEPDGTKKNTSLTSFVVGRLFVTCYYSDGPDRLDLVVNEELFRRLWPSDGTPIEWHPPQLMTLAHISDSVWTLNRFITGPKARWRPVST